MVSGVEIVLVLVCLAAILGLYVVRCLHRIRLDVSRIRDLMERETSHSVAPTVPTVDTTLPDRGTPTA